MLTAGLLLVVNYLLNAAAPSASPSILLAGILPGLSIISLVLALALGYMAVRAWQGQTWSGAVWAIYAFIALTALGFVPFLTYWNLLGRPL